MIPLGARIIHTEEMIPLNGSGTKEEGEGVTALILSLVTAGMVLALFNYTAVLLATLHAVHDPPEIGAPLPPRMGVNTDSPITILQTLRPIGGRWSPWRGISATAALALFDVMLRELAVPRLQPVIGDKLGRVVGGTLSLVLLARLGLAANHIQISTPAPRRSFWYDRYADTSGRDALKTVPAVAIHGAIVHATAEIPFAKFGEQFPKWTPYLATLAAGLLLVLPSTLALARVRASLLPKSLDAIVDTPPANPAPIDDTAVNRGEGFLAALRKLPRRRLLWFLAKGLPVWGAVNGVVLAPVVWEYYRTRGSSAWRRGGVVAG